MRRFASDESVLKILDVVPICVRGKTKNVNVYIEALCIPFLCLPLQDQTLNGVFNEKHDYLKDLALSDDYNNTTDKSVDLLIGLNFYYNFLTGKNRRGLPFCPVAVDSIFGWILCGYTGTRKTIRREIINFVYSVTMAN